MAKAKMETFGSLSGAAFMKMDRREIAALSRDELLCLAFRSQQIARSILVEHRQGPPCSNSMTAAKMTTVASDCLKTSWSIWC